MKIDASIFVAGGNTLIGSAIQNRLTLNGFTNLVGTGSNEPALDDSDAVEAFFRVCRPEYVFLAGGRSGGIALNLRCPAELMLDNLRTIANVVDAAHRHGTRKLLYLASSCAYPKLAPQPLRVESLGSGPVEPSSAAYATAKFAGWKLCEAYRQQYGSRFITGFLTNSFGPHDDFDLDAGHVIPALIRRCHEAKQTGQPKLQIWGSGKPRREFLYSLDLADACIFAMLHYEGEAPLNLAGGADLTIAQVARTIADVVDYSGQLVFDTSKPDGAPLKALDGTVLQQLGWKPRVSFEQAVAETYEWYLRHSQQEEKHHACTAV